MNTQQNFINAGFSVWDTTHTENKLLQFLKEHYPQTIQDNELKINELKAILGIPFDEKTNGYGLNFVGRNIARAKYGQPTQKEVLFNPNLSLNPENAQNMVLKGDNLDSLKLLKSHYTGKIKCIYIDPPYNTGSDEFVYPDKFDKEETELLGIAESLSEEDFARMEFSFKTKKSHNGWLSFMYPRLLLARDLLAKDGVIFISIDDNEQANLKILCDEIFGEEKTETYIWNLVDFEETSFSKTASHTVRKEHEYILAVFKSEKKLGRYKEKRLEKREDLSNIDNDPRGEWFSGNISRNGIKTTTGSKYFTIITPKGVEYTRNWTISKEEYEELLADNRIYFSKEGEGVPRLKIFKNETSESIQSSIFTGLKTSITGKNELKSLFNDEIIFDFPKPTTLIRRILELSTDNHSEHIILDFFAGSGTTGHAVMALNAEDGGNRKFILCQIDEPIAKDKPAYQFCKENGLPPVISSITIERLKRVSSPLTPLQRGGEKTENLFSEENNTANEKINPRAGRTPSPSERKSARAEYVREGEASGFKVFDLIDAPKLLVDEQTGQILFPDLHTDTLSRIYTMVFSVGLDEPTQTPEVVQEDSVYRIDNNYYITNSEKVSKEDFARYLSPENKVYVDGWTASLNATLQYYKDEVKIVF